MWAEDDELVELSTKFEDRLPVVCDEEHLRATRDLMMDHHNPLDVEGNNTVGTIADSFGRDKHEVWQALGYLELVGFARVRPVVIKNVRH